MRVFLFGIQQSRRSHVVKIPTRVFVVIGTLHFRLAAVNIRLRGIIQLAVLFQHVGKAHVGIPGFVAVHPIQLLFVHLAVQPLFAEIFHRAHAYHQFHFVVRVVVLYVIFRGGIHFHDEPQPAPGIEFQRRTVKHLYRSVAGESAFRACNVAVIHQRNAARQHAERYGGSRQHQFLVFFA